MSHTPKKTGPRDAALILIFTALVSLCFNSSALQTQIKERALNNSTLQPFALMAESWHQSMTALGLTATRRMLRRWFHHQVPLHASHDAIGFQDPMLQATNLEPTDLWFSSDHARKMGLNLTLDLAGADPAGTSTIAVAKAPWSPEQEFGHVQGQEQMPIKLDPSAKKVLLIGDSVMGGIAPMMQRQMRESGFHEPAVVHWKVSTGLARADYYNWPKVAQHLVIQHQPQIIVVLFGANDAFKPIWRPTGYLAQTKPGWDQLYEQKVRQMHDILCGADRKVYWLELPPMRKADLEKESRRLNRIFAKAAEKSQGCVQYVQTRGLLGGDEGSYTSYRKVEGRRLNLRARDGIHLSADGGRLVSRYLLNTIMIDESYSLAH